MSSELEVSMRTVSDWQKEDCLFCGRYATQEAVCGEKNVVATIRCCDSKECQRRAKQTAAAQCKALL